MEGKAASHLPVDNHNAFLPSSSLALGMVLFHSVSEKSDCETENAMLGRRFDMLGRAMTVELEYTAAS